MNHPLVLMPPRALRELVAGIPDARIIGRQDISASDVVFDSRLVTPGSLFVALRGGYADGHRFLAEAAERGATGVVVEVAAQIERLPGIQAVVVVPDTRAALALIAANWYRHPADALTVVGVTGTNGKTTTTAMIGAVLDAGGVESATLGTVEMKLGTARWPNPNHQTTPESLHVQRFLRQAVTANCRAAVVEATSHALAMHRLDGLPVDIAVFTNLSHDHLEFHGSFENYRDAKRSLFARLDTFPERNRPRFAVVNRDDPHADTFLTATTYATPLTYGWSDNATVRATDISEGPDTTAFTLHLPTASVPVSLYTLGIYNVRNALAAAAIGYAQGLEAAQIATGLAQWREVAGHLERVEAGQPFRVIVDFAHTPMAFAALLDLLRRTTRGRLIAVFGSAGERDVAKRAMQGEAAAQYADIAYLTNEDPRFEDAEAILRAVAAGCEKRGWREGREFFTMVTAGRRFLPRCERRDRETLWPSLARATRTRLLSARRPFRGTKRRWRASRYGRSDTAERMATSDDAHTAPGVSWWLCRAACRVCRAGTEAHFPRRWSGRRTHPFRSERLERRQKERRYLSAHERW